MTPLIKKLSLEQKRKLDISEERIVKPKNNDNQFDELLTRIAGGETVLVYDQPGEVGQAHALVSRALNLFGERVELVPLNNDEAAKLGVEGNVGAFMISTRPIEL